MHQGQVITVVGGSGFVGRQVVSQLAALGYRLRVIVRDTVAAEFLRTAGEVGQIALEHGDLTRPKTLAGKFVGSWGVVNLVSILYARGRQTFEAVNVSGAEAVASEAAKAGAQRFVQISALGVDRSAATTDYGRTKLAGEAAVRRAFPAATILRPSLIIGPQDGFFQRFASLSLISPVLPLIGGGHTRFQPVLVSDVAEAVAAALTLAHAPGRIYELAGPEIYGFKELLGFMGQLTNRRPRLVNIPVGLARILGRLSELIPCPPAITRDQVALLAYDSVATPGMPGLAELGIEPASIEPMLPQYLARYVRE